MAEGRMIKKRISRSSKFANLKNDKARLLWLLLLPHLDVEGRCEADLNIVKGTVCPLIASLTHRSIASCLDDLHNIGLIILYENKGEKFLQVQRFHDFNTVNPSKEANSHIPAPNPEQLQSNARVSPAEVKEKLKRSKVKYKDGVYLFPEEYQKLVKQFGEDLANKKIEALDDYIGSKGDKYKSHYKTILVWHKRDGGKNTAAPKTYQDGIDEINRKEAAKAKIREEAKC
jgi:hypothetical protein